MHGEAGVMQIQFNWLTGCRLCIGQLLEHYFRQHSPLSPCFPCSCGFQIQTSEWRITAALMHVDILTFWTTAISQPSLHFWSQYTCKVLWLQLSSQWQNLSTDTVTKELETGSVVVLSERSWLQSRFFFSPPWQHTLTHTHTHVVKIKFLTSPMSMYDFIHLWLQCQISCPHVTSSCSVPMISLLICMSAVQLSQYSDQTFKSTRTSLWIYQMIARNMIKITFKKKLWTGEDEKWKAGTNDHFGQI